MKMRKCICFQVKKIKLNKNGKTNVMPAVSPLKCKNTCSTVEINTCQIQYYSLRANILNFIHFYWSRCYVFCSVQYKIKYWIAPSLSKMKYWCDRDCMRNHFNFTVFAKPQSVFLKSLCNLCSNKTVMASKSLIPLIFTFTHYLHLSVFYSLVEEQRSVQSRGSQTFPAMSPQMIMKMIRDPAVQK